MRYSRCAALFSAALLFLLLPVAHAQNAPVPDNSQTPAQNNSSQQKPSPQTYPSQAPTNPPAQNPPTSGTTPAPAQGQSSSSQQQQPANTNPYPEPYGPAPGSITPRGDKFHAPWEGEEHYGLLSRMSIGADVGPLGIGVKGATILTSTIDGRLMGNFFNYNSANFDVEGTTAHGNLHLASLGAAVDFYPKNSIFRVSAGLMMWNANQIKATGTEKPGTSFTLDGTTYYSARGDAATCSTTSAPVTGETSMCPVSATGVLGLHTHEPAFILSGGFGRFVPRSQRHWSFPSEFGVVFMGPPSLDITPSGWVCTDAAETNCSNVADTSTIVGQQFNASLQSELTRWRHSLSHFTVYPIFTYSVVYSFNLRGTRSR